MSYLKTAPLAQNIRIALEVRDPSWYNPTCFSMLAENNAALVLADQPGFAAEGPLTASFVYVRRHGPGSLYTSNYPDEMLRQDASHIESWVNQGKDVFIYFNNDAGGFAVRNAMTLKRMLGLPDSPPVPGTTS